MMAKGASPSRTLIKEVFGEGTENGTRGRVRSPNHHASRIAASS